MDAVSARLETLDKEVQELDRKIEELYERRKNAKGEERAELLERITEKKADKESVRAERQIVAAKLEGGGDSGSNSAVLHQLNLMRLERRFKPAASSTQSVKLKRSAFRLRLIQAYLYPAATALPTHNQPMQCMISGLQLPAEAVVAGQLLPRTEELDALFTFDIDDVYDVRNGLLWCEPIEKAWESGLIAILVDDKGRHVFFVLTDELNSTELADLSSLKFKSQYGHMTFGDLDGSVITFPQSVTTRPFQRILLYCSLQSVCWRNKKGDLSQDFELDRAILRPTSPFDADEKARLEDWIEKTIPEDCIFD